MKDAGDAAVGFLKFMNEADTGVLHAIGIEEMRNLGKRMAAAFPTLFKVTATLSKQKFETKERERDLVSKDDDDDDDDDGFLLDLVQYHPSKVKINSSPVHRASMSAAAFSQVYP